MLVVQDPVPQNSFDNIPEDGDLSEEMVRDPLQNRELLRQEDHDFAVRFTVPGQKRDHIFGGMGPHPELAPGPHWDLRPAGTAATPWGWADRQH